jgi:uncharacterized protein with beta-barrel porin domain
MKNTIQKLKRSTFLAAAALSLLASAPAQGAELNYTVDDLGASRYIVDLYTPTNIGYGAGVWTYGLRPLTTPVLTRSITSATQSGSVNFLGYRNGALLAVGAGVSSNITAYVYQEGAFSSTLLGVATVVFPSPVGVATIPNVSVQIENLGNHVISYNLYNPNTYDSVLNVSNSVIDATPGRNAIHTDVFVNSTLNLTGLNRINGATLVGTINVNSGNTTFNGNVAGTTFVNALGLTLTYTGLAGQIDGVIGSVGGTTLNLMGGNNVNSTVNLNRGSGSNINISGSNVLFNGTFVHADSVNFTTGGSLTLANGVYLDADVNFAGNNATLTVGNNSYVGGAIRTSGQQSGSLVFSGNSFVSGQVGQFGSFRAIDLQGGGSSVVSLENYVRANVINLNAAGIVSFGAGLDTRLADGSLGTLKFFNTDGQVQLGIINGEGYSQSELFGNFVTDTNNNGVLTLVGGFQNVTGQVGALGKSLRLLNVGSANTGLGNDGSNSSESLTVIDGDVFVQTVALNSGFFASRLSMATGHSITGTTLIDTDSYAVLELQGGTQAATFSTIGSAGSRLNLLYSGVANGAVSTITGLSYLTLGTTVAGQTNYNNTLNTENYELGTGTVNFNVIDGTTTMTNGFWFSDAGTANFNQGATGSFDFQGFAGVVNIAAGKNLVGNVFNGPTAGSLNFAGGASQVTGSLNNLALLTVGSAGAGVGASSQGTLTVTGDITATTISLANGSTLVAQGQVAGNIVTTGNGSGALTLTSGNQTVSGSIGSASARLAAATVGASGTMTTFNGTTPSAGISYVNQVTFAGNGSLLLNGANGGAAASGLIGAVDFTSGGSGSLLIGSGVNLTFDAAGLTLQNANLASLQFLGNSTVVGQIGAPSVNGILATSTPRDVYAGANGSVVNFGGKVFVSATTFHVVGTGTVNFADDLVGPLVYEANGTVNFADTKGIVGVVTTTAQNQGILNFLGSTTLVGSIGALGANLESVSFHTDNTQATATQLLGQNIYAADTVIGNTGVVSGQATKTIASIVANIHLGDNVTLADASTTLYTSGAQTLIGSSVDFAHTKNVDGTLSIATVTRANFDGDLTTNGATLGFAIAASPFTSLAGANGLVHPDTALSSRLSTNSGSLQWTGNEIVQVSLLGSLRDGISHRLIQMDGGVSISQTGTLLDNSFVIDTTLALVGGNLVLTTHRDAQTYVTKAGAAGTRGEALALRLGALSAAGTGYTASLQTVFDKLDLDQWGYGNNATNLARQLELLTPAGNGAAVQSAFGVTAGAIGTVLDGTADVAPRPTAGNDYWVRAFGGRLNRDGSGDFAGFRSNSVGAVVGTDRQFGNVVVGLALGYGSANASSEGSRLGDKADVRSTLAGVYFRAPAGQFFVTGMVAAAHHDTQTDRQTAVGERAQADYAGSEMGGALQLGRRFVFENKDVSLTPVLAVDYARYRQDAYAETGAGDIGLNVAARSYAQSSATFALRFAKDSKLDADTASSFGAYVGYKHLLSTPTFGSEVSFVGDTQAFEVGGWQETRKGSITGGLSYSYNPRKGVTYSFQYDAETKSGFNQQTIGARATWAY